METVTLNLKEQKRSLVLNRINQGKLNGEEAGALLGLSVRHVRRMLADYREDGAGALAHGNRGRPSTHRIEEGQRSRIVSLAQGEYAGVNQQHFTELLTEREQLPVSRSTVRRVLAEAGIASPRHHRRRRRKHRTRRERYSQEGMLLQIDGSPHDWLEARGPRMTLLAGVDDATGKILGALFRQQEDAQGYFLLLQQIVKRYGRPLAIYRDRHSIFEDQKKPSLEEQLRGHSGSTQFGRLLGELDIRSIPAYSPQAKGRVERLFGTLQDRLVSELRLHQVSTPEGAAQALQQFLPSFNDRFGLQAHTPGRAYRKLPRTTKPDSVFCFKFDRIVAADNTVRIGEDRIQLQSDSRRANYVHARVQLHIRMDGHIAVYYKNRCLTTRPAPPEAPLLRLEHLRSKALRNDASSSGKIPAKKKQKPSPFKPPRSYRVDRKGHPWDRPYLKMKNESLYPAGDIFTEHLP